MRLVGPGRAGSALARAAARVGWTVAEPVTRGGSPEGAAAAVDLCVIATPDAAIAGVAAAIRPGGAVVAHLAGSLGLDVLAGHGRRAALHPLVSLPDPERGAQALLAGAAFAVAGDSLVERLVADLGGRAFTVRDEDRSLYHAAAVVASNHLVGLLGQVQRLAGAAGLPLDAYLGLVRGTIDNVAATGPVDSLTGPVARGDVATVRRHLDALDGLGPAERHPYLALADECARLAGRPVPVEAWT